MGAKQRAYIFGAGSTGRRLLPKIEEKYEIIGFIDNNASYFQQSTDTNKTLGSYAVYSPEIVRDGSFDCIVIASMPGLEAITKQMISFGISSDAIDRSFVEVFVKSRILFLERLSEEFNKQRVEGALAEGGVLQGDFAKEINWIFPDKKLYLFDTFEGFTHKDVSLEREKGYSLFSEGHLNITSQALVMEKLPHPEKCIFKKGYFPQTAKDVEDIFCFVNLDFDLYNPTLAGLEFFCPRMVSGGVILVHDYFNDYFEGVRKAVYDYSAKSENVLKYVPIGDDHSIAIMF